MESKNGKQHISAKGEADSLSAYRDAVTVGESLLDIDPVFKNWLKDNGFTARWLNAKDYTTAGGFNKSGWRALRMSDVPERIKSSFNFAFGQSPEGFMVRNDLILGIKTIEANETHRAKLKNRADRLAGSSKTKEQGERIREVLGSKAVIDTDYED